MPVRNQPQKKARVTAIVLVFTIIVTFFLSLNMGLIKIAPLDVIKAFTGSRNEQDMVVLFDYRLPRMIIALLIGAGIAVSGAILQSVSQNGLADPGIIGINSGAGLAVVLFIYFFRGRHLGLQGTAIYIMPFSALVGACLATFRQ